MQWTYFMCLLLLGLAFVNASENDLDSKVDDDEDPFVALNKLFEKKCREVGGEEAFNKLTKVGEDARNCLQSQLPKNKDEFKNLVNDSSSSEELCSNKRGEIRTCFNDLIEALKGCSDEQEKYLPEFIFNAIDSVLDLLCANEGAIFLKLFNEDTLDCVFSLMEKENITETCTDQLKFLDESEDTILTKPELCHDLTAAKTCYSEFIGKECPKSVDLKDFIIELYTAVSSPCNTDPRNPLNLNLPGRK